MSVDVNYWTDWQNPGGWKSSWDFPQTTSSYCYNCGMWYWGQHVCANVKPTVTIGGSGMWPTLLEETKMDKKEAILKIAEALAILGLVVEKKMEFYNVIEDVEELLNKALEELLK